MSFPVAAPRRATRVDWGQVARLLAEGYTTGEVARAVGCSRQNVWKILRKSRSLHWALFSAENEIGTEANLRLRGLRVAVAQGLAREVDEGNVRVLLALADRLSIFDRLASRGLPEHDNIDPLDPETMRERDEDEDIEEEEEGEEEGDRDAPAPASVDGASSVDPVDAQDGATGSGLTDNRSVDAWLTAG